MLARRVIAISPDKQFAKTLALGLRAAGGAVESHTALDALGRGELQAALIVVHLEGEMAGVLPELAGRLGDEARIVAVLPKSSLTQIVDIMQISEKIAGVLIAEDLRLGDLSATATRILHGDIFGLEKTVMWGTRVYSTLVGDYQEKSLCISQISEFAELMGVRRKYREAVEQVVDEMLMNALYDAPVDDQGRQIFAEIPTKTRISLRMEQKVVVQYACDGKTFMVSVRDSFGTIERNTVIRYLHKCLHSEQQIDRKTGGAGLGLYLMANATTRFVFNVLPGVATECVCSFDLDTPKVQLETFGFFQEKIDAAGRLAAGPSRLLPAGASFPVERRATTPPPGSPRGVIAALMAAIVLLVALIGMVAYPRLKSPTTTSAHVTTEPPGATIEVDGRERGVATGDLVVDGLEVGRTYRISARLDGHAPADTLLLAAKGPTQQVQLRLLPRTATVVLDSDPTGATVFEGTDNKELGRTPLTLNLEAKASVDLVFKKNGYQSTPRQIRVPGPGGEAQIVQVLKISRDFASIVVTSDPTGADVVIDGQRVPGVVTPTEELLVEAGRSHSISLKLAGHMPAVIKTNPSPGARGVTVSAKLQPGGAIALTSNIDARGSVLGVATCQRKAVPFECAVANGNYKVEIEGIKPPGRIESSVDVKGNTATAEATFGFVEAPNGKKLVYGNQKVARLALEEGKRRVTVFDEAAGIQTLVEVKVVAGKTVSLP